MIANTLSAKPRAGFCEVAFEKSLASVRRVAPILHRAGGPTCGRLAIAEAMGFWLAGTILVSGGELRIERMFGPEVKTGPYKHPARIEELRNGDLYAVYYGGEGEYAVDTGVFGSRLKKASGDRKSVV